VGTLGLLFCLARHARLRGIMLLEPRDSCIGQNLH
jgi:hypothetical protein